MITVTETDIAARCLQIEANLILVPILHRRLTDPSRAMWKVSRITESDATVLYLAELWDGPHKTTALFHSASLEGMQWQLSALGLERAPRLPCDERDVIEVWI